MCAPWSNEATSNDERVRVEVFSKISAISLPSSRFVSVPAYLAVFRASDRSSRYFSSRGSKSISLTKLRFRRLNAIVFSLVRTSSVSERGIAFQWAGHAVAAAASTPQLEALDRDDLDTRLAQCGVRAGVALVCDHHTRLHGDDVVAVVPLLALGFERVTARLDHAHLREAERLAHALDERLVLLLHDEIVGGRSRP